MKINLQSLLTVACVLTISVGAMAQNFGIVLVENFDATTTPVGWTQSVSPTPPAGASSTTLSDGWAFGEGPYTSTFWTVPASIDGSPFAISNDDAADQDKSEDLLMSPVMNLAGYDSAIFLYDVFYDGQYAAEAYFMISYDAGANWLNLPLNDSAVWAEDGALLPATINVGGTLYTFNDQMMIGFLHSDAGAWGSGFAVDNVIVAGYNNPCDDVVTIQACDAPQTVTLGGVGTIDWEFTTGCGYTTFGQEQLYSFTPSVSGVHTLDVTAATGNSWIDYMWKPASAGCDTIGWTCLGDANGVESYGMNLTAGVEYYILADNEFIDSETQTFEISCPCTYTSLGGTPESEACGDDLNGGCNNDPSPATYESILCGETISGTLWADGGNRDTDWYELVVTEATTIEVDYSGGMPINAILIDNCTDFTLLDEATSLACGGGTLSYAATPGTYLLAIVPTAFEAYPCGTGTENDYDVTVTYCNPPANDLCAGAVAVTCGSTTSGDTENATADDAPNGNNTVSEGVWYVLAGTDQVVTASTCGASWDTEIVVMEGSCGSLTYVGNNDDDCGLQSTYSWFANAGTDYYIYVGDYSNDVGVGGNTGTFDLAVTCVAPVANDECQGAEMLTVGTSCVSTSGTVDGATESLLGCLGNANDDVWYSFVADATTATVEVTGGADFDAVLEAFDGACVGTSLGCADLTLDAGTESLDLTGLVPGNTYYFRVYHYYTALTTTPTFDVCVYNIVTGVNEMLDEGLSVYPNPSNGEFTVEMDNVEGTVEFRVYDMAGRTVFTTVHTANGTLREQLNLPTGSFVLQLISDKAIVTERLVVE